MVLSFMQSYTISRPESLLAEIAGNGNSFKMVGFNVISYLSSTPFLSTNFAFISQSHSMRSIGNFILAFLGVMSWKVR